MASHDQEAVEDRAGSYGSPDQTSCPSHHIVPDGEGRAANIDPARSLFHKRTITKDAVVQKEKRNIKWSKSTRRFDVCPEHDVESNESHDSTRNLSNNGTHISERPSELIRTMIGGRRGEELTDAYENAMYTPPITKQSLSELDMHIIVNNIRLRHDVNFDSNLQFRPNFDGAKGQEKLRERKKYCDALVAELTLYGDILKEQGMRSVRRRDLSKRFKKTTKRIPVMFETIRDVMQSLVPPRDHIRVKEHVDVEMLMQQIEKGVCNLVMFAEWISNLLKEHCAPMRDIMLDNMVELTRKGVANGDTQSLVDGLQELFGIFEAMKLDVANHQIRNLKPLLIEDTVNFERNYHMSNIVQGLSPVRIEAAQQWYSNQLQRFEKYRDPSSKSIMKFHIEVFVRAVVEYLFTNNLGYELPEQFYLDHDRLRSLKRELQDLVVLELCWLAFVDLSQRLGYRGPIPREAKATLCVSLFAILTEGADHLHGPWLFNYENVALELVRHALLIKGFQQTYDASLFTQTIQILEQKMRGFSRVAEAVEMETVHRVRECVNSHLHSSPLDLFTSLVLSPSGIQTAPVPPYAGTAPPPGAASDPLHDHLTGLTNRISHIVLLHWRTWNEIIYLVPKDELEDMPMVRAPLAHNHPEKSPLPHSGSRHPLHLEEPTSTTSVVTIATGEAAGQDSQQETQIPGPAREASTF